MSKVNKLALTGAIIGGVALVAIIIALVVGTIVNPGLTWAIFGWSVGILFTLAIGATFTAWLYALFTGQW